MSDTPAEGIQEEIDDIAADLWNQDFSLQLTMQQCMSIVHFVLRQSDSFRQERGIVSSYMQAAGPIHAGGHDCRAMLCAQLYRFKDKEEGK